MHMYKHKYIRVHTYLRMYHHHHGAVRESAVSPTGTWNGMHECAHVLCGAPPFGGKETMPLGTNWNPAGTQLEPALNPAGIQLEAAPIWN